MKLFVCFICNHVDIIDLAFLKGLPVKPEEQVCTKCKTGTWHNRFEYQEYDPEHDDVVNRPTGIGLG